MDADTPCRCPRCGWLGTIHDSHQFTQQGAEASDVMDVCPRCAPEIRVQRLGQAGLDTLRREYKLLLKPGLKADDCDARRTQIERFFDHIQQPLRQ